MEYRPQSPDLSSYAPQSPDLSAYRPQSPDLSGFGAPNNFSSGAFNPLQSQQRQRLQQSNGFGNYGGVQPTSTPQFQHGGYPPQFQPGMVRMKSDPDDEYMPDAPVNRGPGRPRKNPQPPLQQQHQHHQGQFIATPAQPRSDPTLGVTLRTQFPVARIKRIMQADEDIGKVAQVTPHVVSRALELFMIKLISASADQTRGGTQVKSEGGGGGGGGKGPRKVLAQHMKRAVMQDETFDFLAEIVGKVPDAPAAKAKKDAGSDSDEGAAPKKRPGGRKKRKDSGDDF